MNINIPEKFWKAAIFAAGMFGLFLLVGTVRGLLSLRYVGANPTQTNTITVNGTGDAYAIPDVATFTFTVSDTEKAVADAQTKATAEANAALAVVAAAGVAQSDMQTTSYSISPQYQYQNAVCPQTSGGYSAGSEVPGDAPMIPAIAYCPPGKQSLTGYEVSESIQVKLRDLTKAGALLASLGSAGVENLYGPSFDVDNPDAVQDQARTIAIADAQSKAKELAKELGVSLVAVTDFSESNNQPGPIIYAMNASAGGSVPSAAPAPAVPAGQQKVTDDVSITYEIN